MKRILEGKWDCSQCGQTGIRGRSKACPGCGDPRDPVNHPSEEPYLTSDAEDITNTQIADQLGESPDWICDHCGQANHTLATSCRTCGQTHDGPDKNVQTRVWSGIRNVIPKQVADAPKRVQRFAATTLTSVRENRSHRNVALAGGGCFSVLLVVFFVWSMFFQTHEIDLTVTEVSWSRGVEVEEYRTLQKDDFNPPGDARIHESYRAIHHYDQVLDHYRTEFYTVQVPYTSTESYTDCYTSSNGNGTFTQSCSPRTRTVTNYRSESRSRQVPVYRDVPVYKTKYRYEIDRWVTDFYFTVDSDDNALPFWPENIPPAKEPKHRVGDDRKEEYVVLLAHDEDTYKQTPDQDVWDTVEVGETFTANVSRQGKIRSVEWELAA